MKKYVRLTAIHSSGGPDGRCLIDTEKLLGIFERDNDTAELVTETSTILVRESFTTVLEIIGEPV